MRWREEKKNAKPIQLIKVQAQSVHRLDDSIQKHTYPN